MSFAQAKAFYCLPHHLLVAKLEVFGFDTKTLNILKSSLNQRKQIANAKGTLSDILEILSGVPEGSILGPILFNIFINNLLPNISKVLTLMTSQMTINFPHTSIQLSRLQNL